VNNSTNLRLLTPHNMPSYSHKNGDRIVTINSVTSLHPIYTPFTHFTYLRNSLRIHGMLYSNSSSSRCQETVALMTVDAGQVMRRRRKMTVHLRYSDCMTSWSRVNCARLRRTSRWKSSNRSCSSSSETGRHGSRFPYAPLFLVVLIVYSFVRSAESLNCALHRESKKTRH